VVLGVPSGWVTGSEVGMSATTLVMVFAIQHTQAREQAVSQRKLDELLRAIPGAQERLMMLEEAPDAVLQGVVEDQRGTTTTPSPKTSPAALNRSARRTPPDSSRSHRWFRGRPDPLTRVGTRRGPSARGVVHPAGRWR